MAEKIQWVIPKVQNTMTRPGSSHHRSDSVATNAHQLDQEIARVRQAVNKERCPRKWSRLASLLDVRFDRDRDIKDLEGAIEAMEMSLNATSGSHTDYLSWRRFHGALLRREKVKLNQTKPTTTEARNRDGCIQHLAYLFEKSFQQSWSTDILSRCLVFAEKAVAITPPTNPGYVRLLNHYVYWLNMRYEWTRTIDDLTVSFMLTDVAVFITAKDDLDYPEWATNHAVQAYLYYIRFHRVYYLNTAVSMSQKAVRLTPAQHPDRPRRLSHLAHCLGLMEEWDTSSRPLSRAIKMADTAVKETPIGHPHRNITLSNLAFLLGERFNRHGTSKMELDRAIEMADAALSATPESGLEQMRLLGNLADLYNMRHRLTGDQIDELYSIQCFVAGWNYHHGPPSLRIEMGSIAACIFGRSGNWELSCQLHFQCVEHLTHVAPRYLQDSDKAYLLTRFGSLGADAAAAALIARRDPTLALQVLESSREVVSGHMWDWDVDEILSLRDEHPELVQEFLTLREKLYLGSSRDWSSSETTSEASQELPLREIYEAHSKLQSLAIKTREQGLSDFLQPPDREKLLAAADPDPIIVISISMWRSDALIVRREGVTPVPLPLLNETDAAYHVESLDNAQGTSGRAAILPSILAWLWDVAAHPILDALGYMPRKDSNYNHWPHVWWIPTGLMARFPLHAAGPYNGAKPSTDSVLDRVVSSYAPSIGSLIKARRLHRRGSSQSTEELSNALVVSMPMTPGYQDHPLPYAADEAVMVKALCRLLKLEPICPEATKQNILDSLPRSAIFHFAGHGMIEKSGSNQSYLLLKDWKERPLTMIALQRLRRESQSLPFLAYLSACSSGKTAESALLNEAANFTSFFQRAGFRHVIGTLWSVSDRACVDMARIVYQTLVEKGMSDDVVSRAVHRANRALRDGLESGGVDFGERDPKKTASRKLGSKKQTQDYIWVPYFHYGI